MYRYFFYCTNDYFYIINIIRFNSGNDQMMMAEGNVKTGDEEDVQEMVTQVASFTIIYTDSLVNGMIVMLPFIFTAFIVMLQWMVTTPKNVGPESMITSVLLVQSIVDKDPPSIGYHNISQGVVSLTYTVQDCM